MKFFTVALAFLCPLVCVAGDDLPRIMKAPSLVYIYLDDRHAGTDKDAWFGSLEDPSKTDIFRRPETALFPTNEKVMGQLMGLKTLVEAKALPGIMRCPIVYYPVPLSDQSVWAVYNIEVSKCQ